MKTITTTYHGRSQVTASDGDGNDATVDYPEELEPEVIIDEDGNRTTAPYYVEVRTGADTCLDVC